MTTVGEKAANVLDPFGYWREYPERDLEHVRRYPCVIEHLGEADVWRSHALALSCRLPFCRDSCLTCPYERIAASPATVDDYVRALQREIAGYAAQPYVEDREVIAGQLGGCTAAAVEAEHLSDLLAGISDRLGVSRDAPVSITASPLDLDEAKATMLRARGVTAVELAVQALDDRLLERCGLRHRRADVETAIAVLGKVGFGDVVVGLLYGLPGETHQSWEQTVDSVRALPVESVSLRRFQPAGTPAAGLIQRGALPACPADEECEAMRDYAAERLLSSGFAAVTSRHFARIAPHPGATLYPLGADGYQGIDATTAPSMALRVHSWWRGGEVLGLGVGGSGYLKEHLYCNDPDLASYVARVGRGELPVSTGAPISARERLAMSLVYGLRLLRVSRAEFRDLHGLDVVQAFGPQLGGLERRGLVAIDEGFVRVTYPAGWRQSPAIREAILAS